MHPIVYLQSIETCFIFPQTIDPAMRRSLNAILTPTEVSCMAAEAPNLWQIKPIRYMPTLEVMPNMQKR